MKKILVILTVFAFVSCKNEKGTETKSEETTAAPTGSEYFAVSLDVVAKKDDSFHVFYTEDGSINFTEENSVWVPFKGSENSQKLFFVLPGDKVPNQLRIDFGLNKEQEDVKINGMELSYYGKVTTVSGPTFFTLFRPNEETTAFDVATQTIKRLDKKGVNASIYPLDEGLRKEMEKVTK